MKPNILSKLLDERFILTLIILVVAVVYDFAITFWKPIADPNLVGAVLGVLNTGGLAVCISYWFGTTQSSSFKDATIREMSK